MLAYRHLETDKNEEGNLIESNSQATRKELIVDQRIKVTNVVIKRIPAKPLLNKLRVIHLFEADFNLCLRILMGNAPDAPSRTPKALGEQQFGSRKGESSEEGVLY
jgi:hypothetical protein